MKQPQLMMISLTPYPPDAISALRSEGPIYEFYDFYRCLCRLFASRISLSIVAVLWSKRDLAPRTPVFLRFDEFMLLLCVILVGLILCGPENFL